MNRLTRLLTISLILYGGVVTTLTAGQPESGLDVLRRTRTTGGLIVHLGCGDGKLTAELCPDDRYLAHGLDADAANVEQARRHIHSLRLYGRVSIEQFSSPRLPYADNLVNLVVTSGERRVSEQEIKRVLCPGGLMISLQPSASSLQPFRKPWPEEIDEWTHFRYSAEGNMVSQDELVGPPRRLQWVSGPIFQRHHGIEPSITATVTSGGRLFYIIDEAPLGFTGMPGQWRLVARDAFNGVLHWKRDMNDWGSHAWSYWTESHAARFNHPLHVRKRLIAKADRVYTTLGFNSPITAMDAATGKTVMTYEGTDYADEFVLRNGILYAAVNDGPQRPWPGKGVRPEPTGQRSPSSQKHVRAIDAATGKVLWKAGPFVGSAAKIDRMASMRHLNLTVAEIGVFLIDEKHVVGLNRETGKQMWRIDRLVLPTPAEKEVNVGNLYHLLASENVHTVVYHDGRLFVLHLPTDRTMKHRLPAILQALDPKTGRELWRYDKATPIAYIEWPDVFVIGDTVWLPDRNAMTLVGLDTATGDEKVVHSIEKALNVGHHHRCYPNRASVNFAVLGRRGAEFVDLKTGELALHHWLRTGCRSGHVLGNGLFYRPPDHCQCYMQFQPRGFLAMSSSERLKAEGLRLEDADGRMNQKRLEKGPACGTTSTSSLQSSAFSLKPPTDWPTYRHDPMRSAMATSPIPAAPKQSWEVKLTVTPSAPIVADGKVFVASVDTHQVIALDAATGEKAWTFTAGGRVDSPPTVWRGFVLFGCRDGRVYCLRARDGALAWRFNAAPEDRRIVAFGQIESSWPVCGSVLVAGGTAYFVAGRTSMLDKGVHAYSLDVATGKILDTQHIHEIQTETRTTGKLPEGALSDILTTDGESVYLRKRKLDLSPPMKDVVPQRLAATKPTLVADGGFANRRWFHRAFWQFNSSAARAKGNLIVFDDTRAYVAAANLPGGPNQTFHIPSGGLSTRVAGLDGDGPSWLANPNLQVGGTVLFAARSKTDKNAADIPDPRGSRYSKSTGRPAPAIWRHNHFPVYPWAMVVGNKHLAVAGPTADVRQDDPWANFEGRAGGDLHILEAGTGRPLSKLNLASPPVWNGMAVAGGRLYLSTRDGKLICLDER